MVAKKVVGGAQRAKKEGKKKKRKKSKGNLKVTETWNTLFCLI